MTGFARHDGSYGDTTWFWEVRSVNGRGLDIRLRLPAGLEMIEQKARALFKDGLVRGNVSVSLSVMRDTSTMVVQLNEDVLGQVLDAAEAVRKRTGGELPDAASLLSIKGVLEMVDVQPYEEEREALAGALTESLEHALNGLVLSRREEGERLSVVVQSQIDEIERLVDKLEKNPARQPEAIKSRLAEQVAKLLEAETTLDEARLHQEAALIATRLDIEEEVKRLRAHVAAGGDLVAGGGAVGRRLDFLAQEFNREANTICSKSGDKETSETGLALKVVIDQMREQVQNIE